MTNIVYLRVKKSVEIPYLKEIRLEDIAFVSTNDPKLKKRLEEIPLYRMTKKDNNLVVIDSFLIVEHLTALYQDIDIQLIGPTQSIVRVSPKSKKTAVPILVVVWILLFIGTSMTIMNFHYDVSMQEVHQKLYYLLTGERNEYPLWIQIPYSFGLGIGTLLFFNHWFNKRFNEEPSPLEVEIYNYQQDLDHYLNHYENKYNGRNHTP
ncbi:stage V sporulation protein AA [Oceanobacillus piezotolerans]|uniref:Stage V sporulation protein AA n=1 Tax=Oceanobacillus piezotolerans TaxID=2448030 RepID=A0A498DF51_9BACI|nr:stage V sporulation protein AA [Oceanobacillus piezotolerans]RLL48155.1 stage V sporulation protein AA [Oceanobacillus piezotolerans]